MIAGDIEPLTIDQRPAARQAARAAADPRTVLALYARMAATWSSGSCRCCR